MQNIITIALDFWSFFICKDKAVEVGDVTGLEAGFGAEGVFVVEVMVLLTLH
jgi:hypothetical protein